jgi:hypothetical protein
MLSLQQVQELRNYLDELTERIKTAIETKPVRRKSKGLGSFSSPVTATGRLADSISYEIDDTQIRITALSYIDNVIYGTPPNASPRPTLMDIDNWLGIKGLPYSSFSVMRNLELYGSSIYQEFQGAESNLLEDFILNGEVRPEIPEQLAQRIMAVSIENVIEDLLKKIAA